MGCDIHWVLEQKFTNGKWIGVYATGVTPMPHGKLRERKSMDPVTHDGCELTTADVYAWPRLEDRNYTAFARLASVRGDGPHAKGLPDDISELTDICAKDWGEDGHSHSYDSAETFILSYLSDHERAEYLKTKFSDKPKNIGYLLGLEDQWLQNYRVVYWFDN